MTELRKLIALLSGDLKYNKKKLIYCQEHYLVIKLMKFNQLLNYCFRIIVLLVYN